MTIEGPEPDLDRLGAEFSPLLGLRLDWLTLPEAALPGFEPSQLAVIVNTLIDVALPQIELLASNPENAAKLGGIGLQKAPRSSGEREGYPDYIHRLGFRLELKGLFVDNRALALKRPPTRREPSARLNENVRVEHVDAAHDVLMLVAMQLQRFGAVCSPVIADIGLFSMIACVNSRDERLFSAGGRWYGTVPQVIKKTSIPKVQRRIVLNDSDFERDTNFGKLKRIPHPPLQAFLSKHGVVSAVDTSQVTEASETEESPETV